MKNREQANKGTGTRLGTEATNLVPQVSASGPGRPQTLAALVAFSALLVIAGCRQDMHDQPKIIPQRGSNLFADHRGARPQVVNTVARGQLREDSYFYTGVTQGANGYREEHDELPFPATLEVLKRGQERFNIYCSPCHSRVGNGLGEIVQRGYKPAANLHDQVRLAQPLSHYFYVMSNGYGAMPDYSAQLTPADRWAVAAYIRALQLSQAAKESDVPSGVQLQEPEGRGRRAKASRRRSPSPGRCPPPPCSPISTTGSRAGRPWLRPTPPIPQPTGPQRNQTGNREIRNMAHASHARTLPADLSAPPVVDRWRTRALIVGVVFSVIAALLAVLDHSDRPRAARLGAGPDAHLRLVGGRAGPAHGAVLLGRQVGTAAAPAARSHDPLPARGLRLLDRRGLEPDPPLPVGQPRHRRQRLQARPHYSGTGRIHRPRHRLQAPHAQPHHVLGRRASSASPSGPSTPGARTPGPAARRRLACQHSLVDQEVRKHLRPRHRGLLPHHDRRRHLLGDVDGRHLVLVRLRPAVPGRAGLLGAGAVHHRGHLAWPATSPSPPSCAPPSSTTWASSPSPS